MCNIELNKLNSQVSTVSEENNQDNSAPKSCSSDLGANNGGHESCSSHKGPIEPEPNWGVGGLSLDNPKNKN